MLVVIVFATVGRRVLQFFKDREVPLSTARFHRDETLNFVIPGRGTFYFTRWKIWTRESLCCCAVYPVVVQSTGSCSRSGCHFPVRSFECVDMEKVVDVVRQYDLAKGMQSLSIAGGGAHRYVSPAWCQPLPPLHPAECRSSGGLCARRFEGLLRDRLGVKVVKEDEIATIVNGISFMLENSSGPGELYALEHSRSGREFD